MKTTKLFFLLLISILTISACAPFETLTFSSNKKYIISCPNKVDVTYFETVEVGCNSLLEQTGSQRGLILYCTHARKMGEEDIVFVTRQTVFKNNPDDPDTGQCTVTEKHGSWEFPFSKENDNN